MTLVGAWVLMPQFGIAGVGIAWLTAQTFGALASLPAYKGIRNPGGVDAGSPDQGDRPTAGSSEPDLDPSRALALLIDLSQQQSLEQFRH